MRLPATPSFPPSATPAWAWKAAGCAAILLLAAGAAWTSLLRANSSCQERMGGISAALAGHSQVTMAAARASLSSLVDHAKLVQASTPGAKDFRARIGTRSTHEFLAAAAKANPALEVAAFTDSSGALAAVSRSHPAPSIDLSSRDYFQAHARAAPQGVALAPALLSAPALGKTTRRWSFYLTRRIDDAQGSMIGVAVVGVSVDSLVSFYQTLGAQMGDGFSVSLYREDMMLLARWPRRDDLIGSLNPASAAGLAIGRQKLDHAEIFVDSPRFTQGRERQRRLAAPRKVPGEPLIVAPVIAEGRCLDAWRPAAAGLALLALLACSCVLAWPRQAADAGVGKTDTRR